MIRRCTNPSQQSYQLYGGRGIKVCDRWQSFGNFLADMGECLRASSLDRIDSNGHYEPGNCRWTTSTVQGRNRRNNHRITFRGQTKTLTEWALDTGIKWRTLRARIVDHGWPVDRALTEKLRSQRAHGASK